MNQRRPPGGPGDREEHAPEVESSLSLLTRAKLGDDAALNQLCRRYLPSLRRWAHGRLPRWARDARDTDDLVQETLLQTIRRINDFELRHDGALHAYLRQAFYNRIREEIRKFGRRPPASEISERELDPTPSPLEELLGTESLERYEAALARLSPVEREAIVLRVEMRYGYARLADALGKPSADAARMTVTRALMRLAREMGHER